MKKFLNKWGIKDNPDISEEVINKLRNTHFCYIHGDQGYYIPHQSTDIGMHKNEKELHSYCLENCER
jgi:hypothetical protein